jgi:hypothetical protein
MDIDPVYDPSPIHDKYLPVNVPARKISIAIATLIEKQFRINQTQIENFYRTLPEKKQPPPFWRSREPGCPTAPV